MRGYCVDFLGVSMTPRLYDLSIGGALFSMLGLGVSALSMPGDSPQALKCRLASRSEDSLNDSVNMCDARQFLRGTQASVMDRHRTKCKF